MNERIKELINESTTIEYGVDNGFDRVTFDKEKFAELLIRECSHIAWLYDEPKLSGPGAMISKMIEKHFGVEEPKGWVCNKCGTDRTKSVCPYGHTAALTGECPMVGVTQ